MRKWLLAWALSVIALTAFAQGITSVFPGPGTPAAAAASFQGIGDIQSGAKVWVGIIPYSAAYATALGNAFDFSCNSGVVTGTIPFKANGTLNLTGIITTCVGTISVTKLYDQSGSTFCNLGASNCDMATISSGSISFLQSGCPATSVITYCLSITSLNMKNSNGDAAATNQPFTYTMIIDRTTGARGSFNSFFSLAGTQTGAGSTNDTAYAFVGASIPTATMSDGTLHTLQVIFHDATQSYIKVDNAAASAVSLGSTTGSAQGPVQTGYSNVPTGYLYGAGIYASDLGTTVLTNIANNECKNSGSAASPAC